MPMNLDSVGAGLVSPVNVRGPRRTRCSTRSASARARPTRPVSSSSSRPRTARTSKQRVLPTYPRHHRRWPAAAGLPSFGDFNWAMLVHGEQGIEVLRRDPGRRHGRCRRRGSSASTTRARARSSVMETESKYNGHRQARVHDALRRVHPRRGRLRESRGDELAGPAEGPGHDSPITSHLHDASRPGRCSTASRATATRCTPTRRSRSSPASRRPILHGLCTYGFTGRALLHALCGSDPAKFKVMDARFSKPVMPGDALTVKMWVDGERQGHLPDGQPGRRRRHRRRHLRVRVTLASSLL